MLEFFEIIKIDVVADTDEYIIVEECGTFDSALSGFVIICRRYNLDNLLAYIEDAGYGLDGYIQENFATQNYFMALDVVKSSMGFSTFTEEVVKQCQSIQGFLDVYGGVGSVEYTEDVQEQPSEQIDFEPDAYSAEETDEEEPEIGALASLSGIPDDGELEYPEEPEDPALSYEEDSEESYGETGKEEETYGEQWNPEESSGSISVDLSKHDEPEPDPDDYYKDEPVDTEPDYAATETTDYATPSGQQGYLFTDGDKVSCVGLDVPGVTYKDGKIVVPFNELCNLVTFVVEASQKIEREEVQGLKILTEKDRVKAAAIVDQYSPSVIKEFLLKQVLNAEKDTELIRITSLLNDFSTYIVTNKIGEC